MKQNKQFTIDIEIVEKLAKEKNASGLINDLLKDYYTTGGELQKKEIEAKIANEISEITKHKSTLSSLKNKLALIIKREAELKEIYKDIPTEILDDFKAFPSMTLQILRNRNKEIYSRKYKEIEWPKLEAAYNHYFSKGETTE
jgi:hypothetical protein